MRRQPPDRLTLSAGAATATLETAPSQPFGPRSSHLKATGRALTGEASMDYVRLGKTGLKISRIALGCMSYGDPTTTNAHTWALDDDDAQPFFRQAVEMGVTFWDTANTYQLGTSEEVVGRAIRRYSRREDIVLGSSLGRTVTPFQRGQGRQGLRLASRRARRQRGPTRLRSQGREHGSGCAGVGAEQSRRLRTHRRSHQAPSPAGSDRSTGPAPYPRRDPVT